MQADNLAFDFMTSGRSGLSSVVSPKIHLEPSHISPPSPWHRIRRGAM